jgi:hypothetical protein
VPGHEADHSPPFSTEVNNEWSYTSTRPVSSWCGAQLKNRDNFTFYQTHIFSILMHSKIGYTTVPFMALPVYIYILILGAGIAQSVYRLGYGLDDRGSIPGCAKNLSLCHRSPPSSVDVKNAWSYTSTSQFVFMVWCFVKHRDNLTFTFTYILHRRTCTLPQRKWHYCSVRMASQK